MKHVHRMLLDSPSGAPTIHGKCACGHARNYPADVDRYIPPAEPGGKWRPKLSREFALAEER